MKPGQPAVSTKKTVTAAARAGTVLVAALVALAAPFSVRAATDPGRNEPSTAYAKVGDDAFHWIDATTVDTNRDLAEADAPPAQGPASRTAEIARPHDADKSPSGLDLIDKIQDWLARANREYETTIIPRLSTPSPDAEAVARQREQIKEEDDKAAEAKRRAEEARKADAARKAEEARRKSAEAKQAEAARKAAEEAKQAEAARKAADEAKQAEAARKAAEEAKQAEAARKAAEEAKQAEAARKAAEEAKQAAAARKAADEAKQADAARKAADEAKQAEAARKAAEQAKQAEAARKAEEEAKQAEAARKAAEEAKQAEAARKAADEAKQAEAARKAADEAKQADTARKAAEEAKQAEQRRTVTAESAGREGDVAAPPPQPIPEPGSMQAQKLPGEVLRPEPAPESDSDLKEAEPSPQAQTKKVSQRTEPRGTVRRWVRREHSCRLAGGRIGLRRHYTVRRGDSLWRISRRYYRNGRFYFRLYHANRRTIRDPDLIFPCQRIFVPRRR